MTLFRWSEPVDSSILLLDAEGEIIGALDLNTGIWTLL